MHSTTILYTLAVAHRDGDYCTVAQGVDERQCAARIAHEGVELRLAHEWLRSATSSAYAKRSSVDTRGPSVIEGDLHTFVESGPRRESFRVLATAVVLPSLDDGETPVERWAASA